MAMQRRRRRFLPLLPFSLLFSGCLSSTPFQSARTTDPGRQSGNVSLMRSKPVGSDGDATWYMMEFGGRSALKPGRSELSYSAAIVAYDGGEGIKGGGGLLGLGVKFELLEDRLALEVPARFMIAGAATLHTIHFYPRVILSQPQGDGLELTLSYTRFLRAGGEELYSPWGCAAGLAIGRRGGHIVRPEVGMIQYPDGERVIQVGIAYTPEFAVMDAADQAGVTPH